MKKIDKTKKSIDHDLGRLARDISDGSRDKLSDVAYAYMRCVVDPKTAKAARIPTLLGGEPGLTSVMKVRMESNVVVGANGFGFISVQDSSDTGFYNDRIFGTFSADDSFLGVAVEPNGAGLGVGTLLYTTSPHSAAGGALVKKSYRLVGQSIEIFPSSSVTDMNGSICLCEPPSHDTIPFSSGGFDYYANMTRSRVIRGTQLGKITEDIVLNVHPVAVCPTNEITFTNPFGFNSFNTLNLSTVASSKGTAAVVLIKGTKSTSYRFIITAIYEFRGKGIPNPRAGLTDSRGMNLVLNAFRTKQMSGWVGSPHTAETGYLAALWKQMRKLDPLETFKKTKNFLGTADRVIGSLLPLAGF